MSLLDYLRALSFEFQASGQAIAAVRIYAEPNPAAPGTYRSVLAAETGLEGVACVDDTARAALLALGLYERTGLAVDLQVARHWLDFVAYMQYPDGSFANFILDFQGTRNEIGRTSEVGGYWWSARALWALARAYRVTGEASFLERFQACTLEPLVEGKINGLLALAKLELYERVPSAPLAAEILEHCRIILDVTGQSPYLLDQMGNHRVHLWGYHQVHALANTARQLDKPALLSACRQTVRVLIEPDIEALMWHAYPTGRKEGVTAYDVTPIVQGLAALYRATLDVSYHRLALLASEWFYGRNDAGVPMYDPAIGRCRDGISDSVASDNYGAESAIEAGLAQLERERLFDEAGMTI